MYTKDRFGLSKQAYHELSMVCKEFPRSYKIKERMQETNKKWNLFQTPGNTVGVQQSIKSRLETRLKVLLNKSKMMFAPQNNKVRINLSGDGTNGGKHLHVINVTFCCK